MNNTREKLTSNMDSMWNDLTNNSSTIHPKWYNRTNQTFTKAPDGNNIDEQSLDEIFFIIASSFSIVGAIGDLAIIFLFIFQKKLEIPTYTGIFCSTVADFFALILRYFSIFQNKFPWVASFQYFYGLTAFTTLASNYHLLTIAIIRYIYISKPFYSLTFTYAKVVYISLGVWIFSLIMAILYSVHLYLFYVNLLSRSFSAFVELSFLIFSGFGSLIPIAILHIVNIINIRKGLSKSVVSFQKKMSAMLAAIIIISIVANFPGVILNILYFCNVPITGRIVTSASILILISYSSNPFVYFLFSKKAKKCKCLRN